MRVKLALRAKKRREIKNKEKKRKLELPPNRTTVRPFVFLGSRFQLLVFHCIDWKALDLSQRFVLSEPTFGCIVLLEQNKSHCNVPISSEM